MSEPVGLTSDELEAMALSAKLANLVAKIIKENGGSQAEHDWTEFAMRIHAVQHMIMAQAASRAHPDLFRPLGGTIEGAS